MHKLDLILTIDKPKRWQQLHIGEMVRVINRHRRVELFKNYINNKYILYYDNGVFYFKNNNELGDYLFKIYYQYREKERIIKIKKLKEKLK